MSIVVTFYNHKGGVSKTTTTFNLAHHLADEGYNILVVDADPQCNMTEISLSPLIGELDEKVAETGVDNLIPGTSLLDILTPRINGDAPNVDTSLAQVVSVKDNLDLIRGDVDLNRIEDVLAEAHIQRFSNKTHEKKTYVAIGDFLNRFGQEKGYHYIFIDLGPSSGALTRTCFLACDAFFLPVSPDRFNVQAVSTMSSILDRWLSEHSQIYNSFLEQDLPVKVGKPFFMGTVTQHFKVLKGRPKLAYQMWMDRIPIRIKEELFPVLQKHSNDDYNLTLNMTPDEVSVAEIPDFGTLAPLMQEYGKAVFQITQQDTAIITPSGKPWGGATWINARERMVNYRSKFKEIENKLLSL